MITLIVERHHLSWWNKITILKDSKGAVKAIIPNCQRQPRYAQKTITLNHCLFALDWSNVEKPLRRKISAKEN